MELINSPFRTNQKKLSIAQVMSQKTRQRTLQILERANEPLKTSEVREKLYDKYSEKINLPTISTHLKLLYDYGLVNRDETVIQFKNQLTPLRSKTHRSICWWRISEDGRRKMRKRYGL